MDWAALGISSSIYGAIIAFIAVVGTLLHQTLKDQSNLGKWLDDRVTRDPLAWIHSLSNTFLGLFDYLYASRAKDGSTGKAIERALWIILVLSPVLVIQQRVQGLYQDAADMLLIGILYAIGIGVGIPSGRLVARIPRSLFIFVEVGLNLVLWGLLITTIAYDVANHVWVTPAAAIGASRRFEDIILLIPVVSTVGFSIGLIVGLLMGHWGRFRTREFPIILYSGFVGGVALALIVGVNLEAGVLLAFALGLGTLISLPLAILIGLDIKRPTLQIHLHIWVPGYLLKAKSFILPLKVYLPIHPLRAFLGSLIFIVLIGFIKRDAGASFIAELYANPRFLAFVALNIFADAFSLVETRWMLDKGTRVGVLGLGGLLAFDILLSGVIFLFLPLVLGELPNVLGAILFGVESDRQWLGILFWTTFSTSAVFYLFVIASLLVRPLSKSSFIGRYFQVEAKPVLALTLALILVVTFIYWSAFGVTAVI